MRGRKESFLWMRKLRPEQVGQLLKDDQTEGRELDAALRVHMKGCDDTCSWVRQIIDHFPGEEMQQLSPELLKLLGCGSALGQHGQGSECDLQPGGRWGL